MPIEPHTYWEPWFVSEHVWEGMCLRRGAATPADQKSVARRSKDYESAKAANLSVNGPCENDGRGCIPQTLDNLQGAYTDDVPRSTHGGSARRAGVFGKSSLLIQPIPASPGHRHRVCDDLCFDGAWS